MNPRQAVEYALVETQKLLSDIFKDCIMDDDCMMVLEDMHDTIVKLIIENKYEVSK